MKLIASILWTLSEWSGIGLGRFAPTIFGWKLGSKPIKQHKDSEERQA